MSEAEPTQVPHFIDGQEVESVSGRTFSVLDPSTGSAVANVSFGEDIDVDHAVQSANRAFHARTWSKSPRTRRASLLRLATLIHDRADEIAAAESQDSGKPIAQAISEVHLGADSVAFFAGHAELPNGRTYPADDGYFVYSTREPYGVVAAIAPWNYPFLQACWKVAPALAAGNCVVLKMSEQTPLSTSFLARLGSEAGLPAGVLNVVHGNGSTTGASLVQHPDVSKITFTGSTATGQGILRIAADRVASVHLELGGKSPNIIFADADIELAVAGSLFTAFYNSGQICTSGSRLLIQKSRSDEFIDAFVERAKSIRVGMPLDAATQIGPLVSQEQLEKVISYIDDGVRTGAALALGGSRLRGALKDGYFVEPTIFVNVSQEMRIAREEIFGPVLTVMTFDDEEEAIRIANDVMYGLAATVWTTDLGRAFRVADRIDTGIVWTNCPHYLPVNVPYEGRKMSGLGEDLGVEAHREFTHLKTHCVSFDGAATRWA